jgi:hypothetical protein
MKPGEGKPIEDRAYDKVMHITKRLKEFERKIAIYLYAACILSLWVYIQFVQQNILLLTSIIFFGTATTILFRGRRVIRLGGILSYPLLLYYSLGNTMVLMHFFVMALIGFPIGIALTKKGYIGQVLFYALSLVVFPLTVVSYYFFSILLPPASIIPQVYHAGEVIYLILPQIYIYNLLKMNKNEMMTDIVTMLLLTFAGWGLWSLILVLFL